MNVCKRMTRPTEVLLAEDNADDVFLLREAFRKAALACELHVVTDGLEALEYLKGQGAFADRAAHPFPDLLLLDLNMPRMNGFEVLEWIRHDPFCKRMAVHVLSASAWQADIERASDLCANSYVVKPTRLDELVAFVTALHNWHRFVSLPRPPIGKAKN